MSRVFHFRQAIDTPWTALPPIRVGQVPSGLATPSEYLLIERDGQPECRADLFQGTDELYTKTAAVEWGSAVLIGFGHSLYLIDVAERTVQARRLPSYFDGFYSAGPHLLVAFGEGLLSLRSNGQLEWQNANLAIDGIEVTEVKDGVISGRGEWDPPGGWQPFRVDLETGEILNGAA